MEIKELMIGDWVHHYMAEYCQEYIQISREDMYDLCCEPDGEDDRLRPIPLTEEILEANGFEVMHFSPRLYSNFDLYKQDILIEIGNIIMYPLPNGRQIYEGYKMVISVPYVHELQHALRLFGLNDIADNFKVKQI